jgi:hypothetical protein
MPLMQAAVHLQLLVLPSPHPHTSHACPAPAPSCHPCRELLDAGFKVRAGARNLEAAEANADIAGSLGLLTPEQRSRLSFHQFDLSDPDTMTAAIGNAAKVGTLEAGGWEG